jgi:TonB-dependent starch-binding outer membrane protein SusC
MKLLKTFLLILPLLLLASIAFSQKKEISGKVIDQATGQPLEGVSILTDNKKVGIATKANGEFVLSIDEKAKTLMISFVGYITQIIPIEGQSSFNISLVSDASIQSDVVVIGYGSQKKANVTGAVAKYKNDRLDEIPVSRVDQALQGKLAGVNVQNISSEAGAEPVINIRGTNSINAGSQPLVVIDGQITLDGLGFLNPADVASIEVLKDASSAAIYGSRASNGVILVTTKKGSADKPKYNFKYSIGQKRDYKRYDIQTTQEYVGMLFDEMAKKATDPTVNQATNTVNAADRASYIIADSLLNGSTDWQNESLSPAMLQNVQFGVSGGSKTVKYFFSAGYQGEDGMMYKSNYEKFNVRAKLDIELSKKVKLIINMNPSYTKRESPSQNFTNFWRMPGWLPVRHNEATAEFVRKNPQYATIKAGDYAHQRHFSGLPYSGTMPDGSFYSTNSANPGGSAQQNPKSEVDRTDINTKRIQAPIFCRISC